MCKYTLEQMLKDKRVVDEIQRHQWFEGEKKGYDIGFMKAAEDWYKRFASEWLKFHTLENSK